MLPRSDESGSTTRARRPGQLRYLKVDDVTTDPQTAKVLGVKVDEEGRYGTRVVLKLTFKGQTMFWGLGIKKNPNYDLLVGKFGHDENDWVGRHILLSAEQDEFSENFFIRVSFPAGEEAPSKRRR